jgi:hypothetical protein
MKAAIIVNGLVRESVDILHIKAPFAEMTEDGPTTLCAEVEGDECRCVRHTVQDR